METPNLSETESDTKRRRNRPGTEDESSAADRVPPAPAGDDDSPLGDTDQHSNADA
jgi:hypothetical protein